MSFQFQAIGKPAAIIGAVDKAIEQYTGQSRKEFEDAAPSFKTLVSQTVGEKTIIKASISGHASFDAVGEKTQGTCSVAIDPLYGFIEAV